MRYSSSENTTSPNSSNCLPYVKGGSTRGPGSPTGLGVAAVALEDIEDNEVPVRTIWEAVPRVEDVEEHAVRHDERVLNVLGC